MYTALNIMITLSKWDYFMESPRLVVNRKLKVNSRHN